MIRGVHTIGQGQETKIGIEFEAYPHIGKDDITWNILHTNFKGSDWKLSRAKQYDVRKKLSYDEMVGNEVFRVSNDLRRNGNKHSIDLFVSPGFRYNEYDSVGDELWLVEMVAKVRSSDFIAISSEMFKLERTNNVITTFCFLLTFI